MLLRVLLSWFALTVVGHSAAGAEINHFTVRFFSDNHPHKLHELVISPNGEFAVITTSEHDISLIRIADGELLRQVKNSYPSELVYSRDGTRLVASSALYVKQLDARNLQTLQSRDHEKVPEGFLGIRVEERDSRKKITAVSPNLPAATAGKPAPGDELIAIARGEEPQAGMVNEENQWLETKRQTLGAVERLLIGRPGTWVRLKFIAARNGQIETVALRLVAIVPSDGKRVAVPYINPRGERISIQREFSDIVVRDGTTGRQLGAFRPVDVRVYDGVWMVSPDEKRFAITSKFRNGQGIGLEVFDLETGMRIANSDVPIKGIGYGTFDRTGNAVLVGGKSTMEVYDVKERRWSRSIPLFTRGKRTRGTPQREAPKESDFAYTPPFEGFRVAASSNGLVAVGSDDGYVRLLDDASGELLLELPRIETKGPIEGLQFTPDGSHLLYFLQGTLHIVSRPFVEEERP